MTQVFELSDAFVGQLSVLDPFLATGIGERGHDDEVTDYSPDGVAQRVDLARATLRRLEAATEENDDDRIAAAVLRDRLTVQIESFESGHAWRQLSNFDSPITFLRTAFDLSPRDTREDWEHLATRMTRVPDSLAGFTASLRHGLATGQLAARRQALVCAEQAATLGGVRGSGDPYFVALAATPGSHGVPAERLRESARVASAAYADLARFLREEYAPRAPESDAVGEEAYSLGVRRWLGTSVDLREVYAWGWDELHRIDAERERTAERVAPGAGVEGAVALLREDPARSLDSVDQLLGFLQELSDRTIAELNGVHFDIPEQIRRIECCAAPPGAAAAMYYTAPSADFSRPGRTWYPNRGRTRFPLWTEVSTAYHEGAPGHHLQIGLCMTFQDRLTRFQRQLGTYAGHAEGWALYAERLMQELGYLENPDHLLGMLSAQAFRAMRVVVDIGLHLQLEIPRAETYLPGQVFDFDTALPFVGRYCDVGGPGFALSELERYCGMPAQAISYKVGERTWLDIRAQSRARLGSEFDLKRFHMDALHMGSLPLDQLERELLR
ncbi:MAG TPA: DUF885 domain-containing protein [Candidatus Saccharimonadales bacterium]|nr:DUF885 domain-containing protein [Candidatus Saccharimonadales bacterium]